MKSQKQFTTRMYGDAITERMHELGLTKTQLAHTANISAPTLYRAIRGQSVHMRTICAICHSLQVDDSESNDFWETDYYRPQIDAV